MSRRGVVAWPAIPLNELVGQLEAGVSVNADDRPTGTGEIGVLKTGAVSAGVFYPEEHKAVWPRETSRVRTSVEAETIIVSRMNTPELVGENAYVDTAFPNLFLPDRLWRLKVRNPNDVSVRWLSFLLASPDARRFMNLNSTGTSGSMKNLPKARLLAMPVLRPPLPEQRFIADILDTLEKTIRNTEKVIGKFQQMKQGLLKDLLTRGIDENGEVRAPEKNPKKFVVSSDGLLPKSWEVVELGDVVAKAEYGISVPLFDSGAVPVLRMNNFVGGEADLRDVRYSDSLAARGLTLKYGDVLFNRTNSIDHVGRTGIWRAQLPVASFASYLVRLVPATRRLRSEFLNLWLNLPATQIKVKRWATPAVQQANVNPTNLRRTLIALPTDLEEQDAISSVARAHDARLEHELRCLDKLRMLKAGLVDDLLTGRVRAKRLAEAKP
jgi:type I restriction enzyme S subunit